MKLSDQLALFFPVVIDSMEKMQEFVQEMKSYASSHPFDHDAIIAAAQKSPELKTERSGDMIQIRGYDPALMDGWQKFVTFDNGKTPPIQILWTVGSLKGIMIEQLVIVDYAKVPLTDYIVGYIASHFWEDRPQGIVVSNGTPEHVVCLTREVDVEG